MQWTRFSFVYHEGECAIFSFSCCSIMQVNIAFQEE